MLNRREKRGTVMWILLCITLSVVLVLSFATALPRTSAQSSSLIVNTLADTNDGTCDASNCTLREAIANATSGTTITFASGLSGTITLTNGALTISTSLTITGPGAKTLAVSGNNSSRVFNITSGTITLANMTIRNGQATGSTGGGIRNTAALTIIGSEIAYNTADVGGGIYNTGTLNIFNSTFANNTATNGSGGGLEVDSGVVAIKNSTISNNSTTSGNQGGGIAALGATSFAITNSTIGDNRNATNSNNVGGNIFTSVQIDMQNTIVTDSSQYSSLQAIAGTGRIHSLGHNMLPDIGGIFGDTATNILLESNGNGGLASLSDNGGPTRTQALMRSSPAIDAGDPTACSASPINNLDQRGVARPLDGNGDFNAICDIGAYEAPVISGASTPIPTPTSGSPVVNTTDDIARGDCSALCSLRDALTLAPTGATITFSVTGTITLANSITISRPVTITGPGASALTINASNGYDVFDVLANAVTISALRLGDDHASVQVLYVSSAAGLSLSNVKLENDQGSAAVIDNYGSLTVQNSTAATNSGTLIVNGGTLAISGSTFNTNGIVVRNESKATVSNSAFSGNTTAIINDQFSPVLTITNSTFDHNSGSTGSTLTANSGTVTITASAFTNNTSTTGGAIMARGSSNVTINQSLFANNTATGTDPTTGGGVIYGSASAVITVVNSTLTGNTSGKYGGAVAISTAWVILTNDTIAGNSATSGSALSTVDSGYTIYLQNTIIANNLNSANCVGISSGFTNNGNNLQFGDSSCGAAITTANPALAALADNGGPTLTMALQAGSPAIDTGACLQSVDQRGFSRPQGTACDIGAYEAASTITPTITPTFTPSATNAAAPVVTKLDDTNDGICDSDCSLREALRVASDGATITFAPGLTGTIVLNSELYIQHPVTIQGPGTNVLTISGNDAVRIFYVETGVSFTLSQVSLVHGYALDYGGALNSFGTVTLNNVFLHDNRAGAGGAIASQNGSITAIDSMLYNNAAVVNDGGAALGFATLTFIRSTLYGNTAARDGGAINSRQLFVYNSTIQGNTATSYAGAIYVSVYSASLINVTVHGNHAGVAGYNTFNGTVTAKNSIIAETANGACSGYVDEANRNIYFYGVNGGFTCYTAITDPKLAPLADNGGKTLTMALLPGSAAVDGGDSSLCAAAPVSSVDQRGVTRPIDGDGNSNGNPVCDIGSFEVSAGTNSQPTITPSITPTITPTLTNTPTNSPTPSNTSAVTTTPSGTPTGSDTPGTATVTPSPTNTPTSSKTPTRTFTPTNTNTPINSNTPTPSSTATNTSTPTRTPTKTKTLMPTPTLQPSAVVNTLQDTNDGACDVSSCSLREALASVASGGTITFTPGLSGTMLLLNGPLTFDSKSLTIVGPGANQLVIDAYHQSGLLVGCNVPSAVISDLTITDAAAASGNQGALNSCGKNVTITRVMIHDNQTTGIYSQTNGPVTITNSTIAYNVGGGVFTHTSMTITNTTIVGNSASKGAGVYTNSGTTTIANSTLSDNHSTQGSALATNGGTIGIRNTIIANSDSPMCSGTVSSYGNNLQYPDSSCVASIPVADPLLQGLANNGGTTLTMAVSAGSPAIDAGDAGACNTVPVSGIDQRGVSRPIDGDGDGTAICDIGAYEASNTVGQTPVPTASQPGAFIVTKLADTNDGSCDASDCSLREAIAAAGWGGTINFASGLTGTISLSNRLTITKMVVINGPGPQILTVSGNNTTGVFTISAAIPAEIDNLTIANGAAQYGAGVTNQGILTLKNDVISHNYAASQGGGIYNTLTLTVLNSEISENSGTWGIGITNLGTATVANTSIFNNHASSSGGGIVNGGGTGSPQITIINTTIANNTATTGGGLYNSSTAHLSNTIIANNSSSNCSGVTAAANSGNNLQYGDTTCTSLPVGDVRLMAPALNGGFTRTLALMSGSAAIDAGSDAICAAAPVNNVDQIGQARPVDANGDSVAHCDIGAFEAPASTFLTPTITSTPTNTSTNTPTATATRTPTSTVTPSNTATVTLTPSRTNTPTITPSMSLTPSQTYTATAPTLPAVNKLDDTEDGSCSPTDCSLREAIDAAVNGSVITFAPDLTGTIELSGAIQALNISKNITIVGPGARLLTISGANFTALLKIPTGATVSISGVSLDNGTTYTLGNDVSPILVSGNLTLSDVIIANNTGTRPSTTAPVHGGAITNTGTLTILRSTLYNNSYSPASQSAQPVEGGAIYNTGTLTIVNSTITKNSVSNFSGSSFGGGIVNNGGAVSIVNSTLADNTSSGPGDNVYNLAGTVTLGNSIIADGSGSQQHADLYGAIISQGHNLITSTANATLTGDTASNIVGYEPRLDGLAYNGGATLTRALLSDSPAIDQGDNTICQSTQVGNIDQRGVARTTDGDNDGNPVCDIGAYEAPDNIVSNPTVTPSATAQTAFVVTKLDDTNDGSCDLTDCSLREAIAAAPSGSTITFASGLTGRLVLNSTLTVSKQITIQGPGPKVLTITSEHSGTVVGLFQTTSTGNLTLANLTLADSSYGIYFNQGQITVLNLDFHGTDFGAIYDNGGLLTIKGSVFYDNHSTSGGATVFVNAGDVVVVNSTFTRNVNDSGGVAGLEASGGTIINSTFAYNVNHAVNRPNNLMIGADTALRNSLIVTAPGDGPNCDANNPDPVNDGNMQFGDNTCGSTIPVADPMLGALEDNGGPTLSLALPGNSPAIDAGDATICTTTPVNNVDQRGQPRMTDGNGDGTAGCDIGAYEAPANANTLPTFTPTAIYTPTSTPTPTLHFTPTIQPTPGIETVTTLSGSSDGVCDADCSLTDAIVSAQSGDTINFAPGLTGTIPYPGGLTLNKNMTIQGPGKDIITLDGGSTNHQMFIVSGGYFLSISGLTLKHGNGILVNTGSTFNLTDSVLTGATIPYGAVIDNFGTVSITNSTITNNTATGSPISSNEVIRNAGGQTLTISGTTITGNGNMGSVVFQPPSGTTNIINGSVISGSTGYGIDSDGTAGNNSQIGTINVTDSTISNSANSGIYNIYGYVNVTHSTITNNSGPLYGGGIYNNNGAVWISDNSTISNNTATSYGAGIYSFGSSAVISIADSKVTHNTGATLGGGGIANRKGSQLTVSNSQIGGDSPNDGNIGYRGGGIYNAEGSVVYLLDGSLVANNIATDGGAGIYNAAFQPASNVDVEDSTIRDNTVVPQDYIQLMSYSSSLNALQSSPTGATVTIHLSQPAIGFSFKQWLQGACLANQTISLYNGSTLVATMDYNYCSTNHDYIGTSPFDTIMISSPGTTNQIQLDGLELTPYNPNAPTFTPTFTPTPRPTRTPTPSATPSATPTNTAVASSTPITAWAAAPNLIAPANNANVVPLTPSLTWSAVTGATQYLLQLDDDPAFGSPLVTRTLGKVTTYAVQTSDGLQYGVPYYWRLQAGDAANDWSHWSGVRAFTVTILKTPLNAAYVTANRPTFAWSAVSGATAYHIQVASDPDFAPAHLEADSTGKILQYTIDIAHALDYGQHYWRVQVTTASGNIPWTAPWTIVVTTPLPAAPAPLLPALNWVTSDNTPDFAWKASTSTSGAPFSYQIQIAPTSNFYGPVQDVVQAGTSYTADTLPDGKYYWRVRTINNVQTAGHWSAVRIFTVDLTPPAAPTLLGPKNWTSTKSQRPVLSWSVPTGAKRYTLQVFSGADCSVLTINAPSLTTASYTVPAAQVLTNGDYCWTVQAADASGNWSAPSAPSHFVINPGVLTAPGTPKLLTPANATSWTAASVPDLTWTMNGVIGNQFEVQIDTTAKFAAPVVDATLATDQFTYPTTTATLPAGIYYWHVRAINASLIGGAWSTALSFTIKNSTPVAPTLLTPAQNGSVTTQHPTLTWQAVAGIKTYVLQVASDSNFASLITNKTVTGTSYPMTVELLSYSNVYYWHVQAVDVAGNASAWSSTWQFTVTVHSAPANGTTMTTSRPTFTWQAVSGATYVLQLANNSDFAPAHLVSTYNGPLTRFPSPSTLTYGVYYWQVEVLGPDGDVWMPAWSFTVTPLVPGAPALATPLNNALTNNPAPTFTWKAAKNAQAYQIQIASAANFASPQQDVTTASGALSYAATALSDGKYYWRVRSIDVNSGASAWSAAWAVTIDTQPPDAPTQLGPADNTTTTNPSLTLRWNAIADAASYEVRLDNKQPIQTPPIPVGKVLSYLVNRQLSFDTYYWQVRAIDAAGNVGAWSSIRSFTIIAGLSSQSIKPTPVPTASSPTPEQLMTIEAESSAVTHVGDWTTQSTTSASGGSYIYSSGSTNDGLMLTFTGSYFDIMYVQHPALGTFAVAIDGTAVKVVTETGPQAFDMHATITGLSAGTHTAHVYPVNGVIAIDGFLVMPQTISIPTQVPATEPPTVATVTPEPSSTPIPTPAPIVSTAEPPTSTDIPTNMPTLTETPTTTPTQTSTETATSTETPTATETASETPTLTQTPTATSTQTSTETATSTATPTASETPTSVPTATLVSP